MAYAEDLIAFARQMAELHPNEANQPSLRRSISTAYYALFHLLISDAVVYCADPQLAAILARLFDHSSMKKASESKISQVISLFNPKPPPEPDRTIQFHPHTVAEAFTQAQQDRLEADYNLLREWQPSQVSLLVESVEIAFTSWKLVRHEAQAKDYLLSMLPNRDGRGAQPPKPSDPPKRQKARPTLGTP